MRPIVPGGYPKTEPIHKIVNFDEKKLIPSINERVWGYVEYERALSAEDSAKYDLFPEPSYEDKAKICRLLCKVIQQTVSGAPIKPALIPETVGRDIARTILPAILRDYADPEIQADFQRWKAERAVRHKGTSDGMEVL